MRPSGGASLVPAINAAVWENALACRIALFRDWIRDSASGTVRNIRIAQVHVAEGVSAPTGMMRSLGFQIGSVRGVIGNLDQSGLCANW